MRCEPTAHELFEALEPLLVAVAVGLQVLDDSVDMRLQALGGELALVDDPYLHMTMFIKAHEKHCHVL